MGPRAGPAAPQLVRCLQYDDTAALAARVLRGLSGVRTDVVDLLVHALSGGPLTARKHVLMVLRDAGPVTAASALPIVVQLTLDPHVDIRIAALDALRTLDPKHDRLPLFYRALLDKAPRVRQRSRDMLELLDLTGADAAAGWLAFFASVEDFGGAEVISFGATFGGRIKDAVPGLLRLLSSTDSTLRSAVLLAVSQAAPTNPDVHAALLAALGDRDPAVRAGAASHLASLCKSKSNISLRPTLRKALDSIDPELREPLRQALEEADRAQP